MAKKLTFYGMVDRDKRDPSKVLSEFPAWYFTNHIEDMKAVINSGERRIDAVIDPQSRSFTRAQVDKQIKRVQEILESRPKVSPAIKDKLAKQYRKLCEGITLAMPTREEEKKHLVDAHEEARKMITPIIIVDSELALACNVAPLGGKVSRNGAVKMFKIIGKYLGERTNVEWLRVDKRG